MPIRSTKTAAVEKEPGTGPTTDPVNAAEAVGGAGATTPRSAGAPLGTRRHVWVALIVAIVAIVPTRPVAPPGSSAVWTSPTDTWGVPSTRDRTTDPSRERRVPPYASARRFGDAGQPVMSGCRTGADACFTRRAPPDERRAASNRPTTQESIVAASMDVTELAEARDIGISGLGR